MKFFSWVQNKFNAANGDKRADSPSASSNQRKKEPSNKEEFSDWPNGLLSIGTFGNKDLSNNRQEILNTHHDPQNPQEADRNPKAEDGEEEEEEEEECSSPDFSEFTAEEVGKLQKELTKLLRRKPKAENHHQQQKVNDQLPLDRFLNCPSSLEVDRTVSDRYSVYSEDKDEEEIDRTIRIILGRCKDVCEKKKNKEIGKKSISFLFKKMFVCTSGFVPSAPTLRDTLQESRMEKLMRTMLTKKVYQRSASRGSSMKRFIEDSRHKPKEEKEDESKTPSSLERSKWDKTDSEFIVLEI